MKGSYIGMVILLFVASALTASGSADPYRVGIVDSATQSPSVVVAAGEKVDMKVIIWNVTLPTVAGSSMYLTYDPTVISQVSCEGSVYKLVNSCKEKAPGRYLVEGFDTIVDNQGYTGDVMVALLRLTTNSSAPSGSTTDLILSAAPLGEALGSSVWGPGWAEIDVTFEGGDLELENCTPGIGVSKVADPAQAAPLSNVTFTITVENTGNCTLDPVTVNDTIPVGMSYVSDDYGGAVQGKNVTWVLEPMASGATPTTVHLVAQVEEDAMGVLENVVVAEGKPGSQENVTDTAISEVTVEAVVGEAGIDVEKEADVSEAPACAPVTYSIEVENVGEILLDPVYVIDLLPEGMSYVSSDPGASAYQRVVAWDLGSMEAGETRSLQLVAEIDEGAEGTLENNVTAIGAPEVGDYVFDFDIWTVDVIPCPGPSMFLPCKENLAGIRAGDQIAVSFGLPAFPWKSGQAGNSFDLVKDQDVCCASASSVYNTDMVGGGDQNSLAGGFAEANNRVMVGTAQG